MQVWCWRNGSTRVAAQQLMLQLDDWWALKDLSYESQAENFRLKNFMSMLLWGHPHHDHLQVTPSLTLQVVHGGAWWRMVAHGGAWW